MSMAILRAVTMRQVQPGDVVRHEGAEWDVTKTVHTAGQTTLVMDFRSYYNEDARIPVAYRMGMTHGARPDVKICLVEYV